MAKKRTKVGFVGLGLMGAPMAECLLKAGYPLTVWNRTPEKVDPLAAAGAKKAASPEAAAKGADFVIVMVADDAALDNVLFSDEGLSRGMKRSSLLINCSTTSPAMSWRAATALRSLKVHYLEAPVMWSVSAAQEGKLQVLVGGSRDDFERAKPVLEALGEDIHYVGEVGKGATMRIACSVIIAAPAALMLRLAAKPQRPSTSTRTPNPSVVFCASSSTLPSRTVWLSRRASMVRISP